MSKNRHNGKYFDEFNRQNKVKQNHRNIFFNLIIDIHKTNNISIKIKKSFHIISYISLITQRSQRHTSFSVH